MQSLSPSPSFSSALIPLTSTAQSEQESIASRIMQFSSSDGCQTPRIRQAILTVLKQPTTQTATLAHIFRNALECGYATQLLAMIEKECSAFIASQALIDTLADEKILLSGSASTLSLTRAPAGSATDRYDTELASTVTDTLHTLPSQLTALIADKAQIRRSEKYDGIAAYLGEDVSAWTEKEINAALITAFRAERALPPGMALLEISDFTFNVFGTAPCNVPAEIKLNNCRLVSGFLAFSNGTVTVTAKHASATAWSPQATAIAGATDVMVAARAGGTAIADHVGSHAQACDHHATALARQAKCTALARDGARAEAQVKDSFASAHRGGIAIASAAHATAVIRSSKHKSDVDSFAIAIGRGAVAETEIPHTAAIALDGAFACARSAQSTAHAYGNSSAEAADKSATAIKHHKRGRVKSSDGGMICDYPTSAAYPTQAFSEKEKWIYKLSDAQFDALNAMPASERRTARKLLDQEVCSVAALLTFPTHAMQALAHNNVFDLMEQGVLIPDDFSTKFNAIQCRALSQSTELSNQLKNGSLTAQQFAQLDFAQLEALPIG